MSTEKNKNVIITKKSREKLVKARAGAIQLPKIVGMVFGDGGVDASGNVIPPTESQIGLTNEIFRKKLDGYSFPADTTCRYECTLTESELAGEEISEIGLYDSEGDVVCIKTFKRKGKDDDVEQTYTLDDIF
uniref:phage tail-collar fiber domain-containing protein n=1 Tax=Enterocloster clostridioformis TaxID=1531 RepID=UPI002676E01E|nr:phage tail protein [Enterocloster clostridioformis]